METIWLEASAGSGKTTFLISQIAAYKPNEILFITFSNAASQELTNRINNSQIKITTLHALAYKIILEKFEQKELSSDTNNLKKLAILQMLANTEFQKLVQWLINENMFKEEFDDGFNNDVENKPTSLQHSNPPIKYNFEFEQLLANNNLIEAKMFEKIKLIFFTTNNQLRKKINLAASEEYITWAIQRIIAHEKYKKEYANWAQAKIRQIIFQKENELKITNNVLYYDDLIKLANEILSDYENIELLFKFFGNIKLFLIDEAQDLSQKQWKLIITILKEWSTLNNKLIIASDSKQLIYDFQGATIESFDYNKKIIKNLSQNFILKSLNSTYRLPKKICNFLNQIGQSLDINFQEHKTLRELEGKVELMPIHEVSEIANYIKNHQLTNSTMVLFKQKTERMKKLAHAFFANGILINSPYIVEHPVIKDFQHLINFLYTNNKFSLYILFNIFEKQELNYDQMKAQKEYDFLINLKQYKSNLEQLFAHWVSNNLVEKFLDKKLGIHAKNFWLEILYEYAIFYKHDPIGAINDSNNFYKHIIQTEKIELLNSGVFFNTIHSSKGMEANNIFLCETDFKSKFKNDTHRLLYVGLTRSKENLIIPIFKNNLENIAKLENTWAEYIVNNIN